MGFEFQTEGKGTQEKQDFRQLDHTGAMSEVKTSNDEKHLKEEGQERQERPECVQEAWVGGPAAGDKSTQKDG